MAFRCRSKTEWRFWRLSGYTEFEKLNIAVRYLVPRQLEAAGLKDVSVELTENAIRTVIHHYTMESGVRNLEREIGSVCRKIAREVLKSGKGTTYRVAAKNIPQYLGVPKFRSRPRSRKGPHRSYQWAGSFKHRRLDSGMRSGGRSRAKASS